MTPCSASRHTSPVPAACLVEVCGERHPVCGACARALADNGVQGIVHPLPDPDPTMATKPASHAIATPNRRLPLLLRPDADAHPELCRVDGCTGKVKNRGGCDTHLTALTRDGDPTAILLPRADRSEAARKAAATRARMRGEAGDAASRHEQMEWVTRKSLPVEFDGSVAFGKGYEPLGLDTAETAQGQSGRFMRWNNTAIPHGPSWSLYHTYGGALALHRYVSAGEVDVAAARWDREAMASAPVAEPTPADVAVNVGRLMERLPTEVSNG